MKCRICEIEDVTVNDNNPLCDGCWFGMRMCTEERIQDMKAKGMEIER